MDEAAKRDALRMIPYALYLVGVRARDVRDPARDLNAFVGSWVTQTSFKPPMLVVCVRADGNSRRMIEESGVLAVSVLGAGQKDLAKRFFKDLDVEAASATEGTMSGVPYRVEPRTGCPIFPDLPAWVACEVVGKAEPSAGEPPDHVPFLARVVDAGHRGPDAPLTKAETGWQYGG